jgi:hypothetical protein
MVVPNLSILRIWKPFEQHGSRVFTQSSIPAQWKALGPIGGVVGVLLGPLAG